MPENQPESEKEQASFNGDETRTSPDFVTLGS